jgi:hypothetical protein
MFSATNETKTHKRMTELAQDNAQIASRLNLLKHRVLEELYDIEKDPDCLVNLIADPAYQHEAEILRDALEQWLRDMQDPMLAAFLGRSDPKILAAYMQEQQLASQERKDMNRAIWQRAIEKKLQDMDAPSKSAQ